MRLKNRKYGRTTEGITSATSTHRVVIGFDAREANAPYPRPGKYNGFVVCRDRIGPDGKTIVDHAIMKRLDPSWSEAKLKEAQKQQLKAPDNMLPKTLHFVLIGDAQRDDDGDWHFPRTFGEAYECWNKAGLFCCGNGDKAVRKQDNGTRVVIDCVPVGREGFNEDKFCPFSMKTKDGKPAACKGHARLTLCLYALGEDGKPQPLCRELGWNARFRFDTSSGYNPMRILAELDAAANRCEGRIHLIRGTLTFGVQKKRHSEGVAPAGQVMFSLSEEDIAARERELHRQKMEREGRVLQHEAPREAAMIGMDPLSEQTVDATEELAAAAAAAEMGEPPWPDASEVYDDGDGIEYEDPDEAQASGDDYDKPPAGKAYPDPEAVNLTIEKAPPKLLADSLDVFIRSVAREEGNSVKDVWRRMGVIELPDGRRGAPQNPHSFLAHSPEWPGERRIDDLRALCREFADNDPRFQLIQSPEPVAAG